MPVMSRSLALGAAVSLTSFVLLFWLIGRVMLPLITHLDENPWFEPVATVIGATAAVLSPLAFRKKKQRRVPTPS